MQTLKLLFLLTGLILFGLIIYETDMREVWAHLSRIGVIGMCWVFVIYIIAFFADVVVWLLTVPRLPVNLRWLKRFYLIRMAGTAFNFVTPMASMGGEPIKAMMLKSYYDVPYKESGVSLVTSKTADTIGLVIFLMLGFAVLSLSDKFDAYYKTVAGVGLIALTIGIIGFFLVQRYRITSNSAGWLSRTRFGNKLIHALETIQELDDKLVNFYTQHRSRFALSIFLGTLNWLLGAVEIYVVMIFLDHPVSFADAMIIESLVQLVRTGTFFIPAGIGAQDGIFFLVCKVITGQPELGVAVAMIRRFREFIWVGLGLLIYWVYSRRKNSVVVNQ